MVRSDVELKLHENPLLARLNSLQEQINVSKRNNEPLEKIRELQQEYEHLKAIIFLPKIRSTLSPPPPFSYSTPPVSPPPTTTDK